MSSTLFEDRVVDVLAIASYLRLGGDLLERAANQLVQRVPHGPIQSIQTCLQEICMHLGEDDLILDNYEIF